MKATLTDAVLLSGDQELLQDWKEEGDSLVGRVLHRSQELVQGQMILHDFMIFNLPIERFPLASGQFDEGQNRLTLEIRGQTRELHMFENELEAAQQFMNQFGIINLPQGQKEALEAANDRWLFERDAAKKAEFLEEYRRLHVPPGMTELPYVGLPVSHWAVPDCRLLQVTPAVNPARLDVPVERGDPVKIRAST